MDLSRDQKLELMEKGYVQIPAVIPQKLMNIALRSINDSLGKGMKPEEIAKYRASSYCPELIGKPAITDLLYKTDVWPICESLIGKGKLNLLGGGQIALRFPVMEKPGDYAPHIDGMYRAGNKVGKGTIGSFTLLAGIFLSDVPNYYWGNFTVWPGTHRMFAEYFKEHGWESLRSGLPKVKMPEPLQLTAQAGDVLLCHYQTAHTVVSNVSPYIRYAIFFRLTHLNHAANRNKIFTDIWLEWPGMYDVIG